MRRINAYSYYTSHLGYGVMNIDHDRLVLNILEFVKGKVPIFSGQIKWDIEI